MGDDELPPDKYYVTGTGQRLVNVHPRTASCYTHGCVLHNPTDPHQEWPTAWTGMGMVRVCPHGFEHPDKDHIGYMRRVYGRSSERKYGQHDCDGCCWMADEKAAAKRKK